MATSSSSLATRDDRPFFDKALRYGVDHKIISADRLLSIRDDLSKGIVQIANYFGTAHLRPELERARQRMVKLVSLYLEDLSAGDLQFAATSLRDKSLLAHSKGGSEMIKRLHAMPDSTVLVGEPVSAEGQRAYLDMASASDTFSLDRYRSELASRQRNQSTIDFAFWLAKKMGVARNELDEADALVRSTMLVIFVDQAELKLPSRSAFVRLIKAARAAMAKLREDRLNAFLKSEPEPFQRLARRAMDSFIAEDLPQIRAPGTSADKLLYGDHAQRFFVRENVDEDVREYDRLVAKEWDRVTRGEADDPAVVATVFLFVATGLPPKATMLLKEAKALVGRFRASGFSTPAVSEFIVSHAPQATREDLQRFWEDDLKREAEEALADNDPNWPDTHMERALEYLRTTCCPTWKGRRR